MVLSLLAAGVMTYVKSQRIKQQFWDASSRRLLINLMIPMVTGGVFLLSLVGHGLVNMIAPVSLVFYGMALINASKYSIADLRYLGFLEIVLRLVSS